ncbi:hypothetical protein CKO42_15540 [Lamprobacter modestohalophilus]|uniref:Uncharacterized protein n=1 Tax=Lamprobacter modestohalophilus TaxID=1064514 RepID=A0A9X1B4T7_9GAMM|nr:hypothetical protein [Lamprobacter modestohalophilus]MBK1619830.1 hypothetical protein [Lamprobacter modestohalophilus]
MTRFTGLALIVLLPLSASPAIAAELPAPVKAQISELKSSCRGVGGKLVNPKQAILSADLNGDDQPDYAIDQSALNCDGAASAFSGSGGSQVDVFVSTPSGYINAWSGGTFGAKVEQQRLWLALGGRYCGQQKPSSRAAAQGCYRALSWNPNKRKMVIDPKIKPRPVGS